MSLSSLLRIASTACLAWCAVQTVAAAAQASENSVYFLGIDHAPAGAQGTNLARVMGASVDDRWALTDTAREIARELGSGGISLDGAIDRWDPRNDPYNFGVISVRGAFHSTLTWPGLSTRTEVVMDLGWVQIGHDTRTRMQQEKLPELRFTVSVYEVKRLTSPGPLSPVDLDDFYRRSFRAAVGELLKHALQAQRRELNRSAGNIRYLQVAMPVLGPEAQRGLAELSRPGETLAPGHLREAMHAHLEQRLLDKFASDHHFDDYVLLPGERTIQYLEAVWSSFADRVAALSTYNGAREALGQRTPQLLRAVPFCSRPDENEVHALEVRSIVTSLRVRTLPGDAYVEGATLDAHLAADVKLPLQAGRDVRMLEDNKLAAGSFMAEKADKVLPKPTPIASGEFLGPYSASMAVDAATYPLVNELAAMLRRLLQTPPLSHPSYQSRFCS
jgi:hypothetical protein